MKKEYLILIALILLLSAYLVFNKENNDNDTLPQITKMAPDKITSIEITKDNSSIVLVKKDKQWFIKKENHLVTSVAVDNMIDALKSLKLSALVSQKSDLKRYELDDEKKIVVKVFEGASPIFDFTMGKTAPTFNHTFIMLGKDTNVYHANGSFRTYFEKSKQEFRDKKVMEFKKESIKHFTITKQELSKTFFAETQKDHNNTLGTTPGKKPSKKSDTTSDSDTDTTKENGITWSSKDGSAVDKIAVSNLLSALSFLECEKYLDKKDKTDIQKKPALCQIELANGKAMTVSLIQLKEMESVSGISSMSEDAFVLSAFNGKEIVSHIDTLLGIKKETAEAKE